MPNWGRIAERGLDVSRWCDKKICIHIAEIQFDGSSRWTFLLLTDTNCQQFITTHIANDVGVRTGPLKPKNLTFHALRSPIRRCSGLGPTHATFGKPAISSSRKVIEGDPIQIVLNHQDAANFIIAR